MAKFVIDDAVPNAWSRLTSDTSSISWISCGYPEGSTSPLIFKGEGDGGFPEFKAALPADDIVWGAFKVVAVDDRGNLVSRRPKYIFVKYAPLTVANIKRAKAGGHKGALKQIITSHVDIEVESLEELTEEAIIQKLRASGGAHQPTGYEFSNYSSGGSSAGGSSGNLRSQSPTPASSPVPAAAPAAAPVAVAPPVPPVTTEEVASTAAALASVDIAAESNTTAAGCGDAACKCENCQCEPGACTCNSTTATATAACCAGDAPVAAATTGCGSATCTCENCQCEPGACSCNSTTATTTASGCCGGDAPAPAATSTGCGDAACKCENCQCEPGACTCNKE